MTSINCPTTPVEIDTEARLRSLLDQVDMAQQRIDKLLLRAADADAETLKTILDLLDNE